MTDLDSGDRYPRPDPTVLTTEALNREIAHVRELYDVQLLLIERQRVESKADAEKALAAAMVAQEKAQSLLAENFAAAIGALTKGLNDLMLTVGAMQAGKAGSREGQQAVFALAGFVVAVLAIAGFLAAFGK